MSGPCGSGEAIDRRGLFRALLGRLRPAPAPSVARALPGQRGALGLLRPPGAAEEARFLALCERCDDCLEVCETGCIRLFGPEAGELAGTPYILPGDRACNLCLKCGPACPTDALLPLVTKTEAAMGRARVDESRCLAHTGEGICGDCHTLCPLRNRALTQGWRNQPYVQDACVGCGLCEEACPMPVPAIAVTTGRPRKEAA